MGAKKALEGKSYDSCDKYDAFMDNWKCRTDISPKAPHVGKTRDEILAWGDLGDEF